VSKVTNQGSYAVEKVVEKQRFILSYMCPLVNQQLKEDYTFYLIFLVRMFSSLPLQTFSSFSLPFYRKHDNVILLDMWKRLYRQTDKMGSKTFMLKSTLKLLL
jgi:hypothetical protein